MKKLNLKEIKSISGAAPTYDTYVDNSSYIFNSSIVLGNVAGTLVARTFFAAGAALTLATSAMIMVADISTSAILNLANSDSVNSNNED